jgi:hypothetical protein
MKLQRSLLESHLVASAAGQAALAVVGHELWVPVMPQVG